MGVCRRRYEADPPSRSPRATNGRVLSRHGPQTDPVPGIAPAGGYACSRQSETDDRPPGASASAASLSSPANPLVCRRAAVRDARVPHLVSDPCRIFLEMGVDRRDGHHLALTPLTGSACRVLSDLASKISGLRSAANPMAHSSRCYGVAVACCGCRVPTRSGRGQTVGNGYTRLQTVWSLPGHSRHANKGHSPRCHRRPNGPSRLTDKVVQPTTQYAEGCTSPRPGVAIW